MQDKPKLSIVAGIYFPLEICFRRFLDACLNQTKKDVEFIFLLDSPEDNQSRNILEEYKDLLDDRFVIVENEKNLGVVDTYLKGCELSKSDYVMIVDSDDFFDNDLIEKMYDYFMEHGLDFLGPKILMSYLGELDIFYALNNNDDADDTGIMFRKKILDEYEDFRKHINYTLIETIMKTDYKVDVLPLDAGSFYYYTITNRSATSSFILQDNGEIPKSKDYNYYKSGVIRFIETFLSNTMNKEIKFENYTLDELKDMAKKCLDLDNFLDNNLTYEDLKKL
jgi:glycosyltransferase involved in cell wall biosynthesis